MPRGRRAAWWPSATTDCWPGSVSGGCIEDDLIDKARQGALLSERPQLIRYGIDADAAHRFGLPCGGMIELVMEPVLARTRLPELLQRLGRGEPVRRVLELATGEVTLEAGSTADELALTETHLVTHLGPHWRLLVIGAGQMTQVLAQMAMALGYQVLVCDPREEYAAGFDVPGCRLLRAMPDDAVLSLPPDGHTAIVALTHDPKLDDLALMEALKSPAFYVGAIGSRVNQARRKARLAEHFGLDEAALERLHGPVGLKNGARTPPEIAVSILAELTAVRYGYRVPEPVAAAAVAVVGRGCTLAPSAAGLPSSPHALAMKSFRIGCGAGFAGDRIDPARDLAERGRLDVLVFECLAERTIALAQRRRRDDPAAGADPLLAERMRAVLPACRAAGTRIVSNMGAANPLAAGREVLAVGRALGLRGLRVAVVEGDDVLPWVLRHDGALLDDPRSVAALRPRLVSANAYLGADALLPALASGAEVIVCGRVADPALFLAPLMHHFGWAADDWLRLGQGIVVGHLLECAAQVSGGYLAEPGVVDVPGLADLGFPLAEVAADGSACITKLDGSGGRVDRLSVTAQLLYEIEDPARYLQPDVVADFTQVRLEAAGPDRVHVSGGRGAPRRRGVGRRGRRSHGGEGGLFHPRQGRGAGRHAQRDA